MVERILQLSEIDVSKTTFYDCIERENKELKEQLQAKEHELIMAKADLCKGCQCRNNYQAKEQECEELSITYDPKKAIEGLDIINKVKDGK